MAGPESVDLPRAVAGADEKRARLLEGDHEVMAEALRLLRSEYVPRAWYIFEGRTCPDVLLIAKDAIVVVEGKRTEPSATTDASWLPRRHQIWRHIDAAWELRGRRAVYGFFIVEGDPEDEGWSVPKHWRSVASHALSPDVLGTSFQHRSGEDSQAIASALLGVTTWRQVCERFSLDWRSLPDKVPAPSPQATP